MKALQTLHSWVRIPQHQITLQVGTRYIPRLAREEGWPQHLWQPPCPRLQRLGSLMPSGPPCQGGPHSRPLCSSTSRPAQTHTRPALRPSREPEGGVSAIGGRTGGSASGRSGGCRVVPQGRAGQGSALSMLSAQHSRHNARADCADPAGDSRQAPAPHSHPPTPSTKGFLAASKNSVGRMPEPMSISRSRTVYLLAGSLSTLLSVGAQRGVERGEGGGGAQRVWAAGAGQ